MSRKILPPTQIITNQSMTGSFVSSVINTQFYDRIFLQVTWSGAAVGSAELQYSNDGVNFTAPSANKITINNNPSNYIIDISATSAPMVRFSYTASSSTGNMNVWISAKESS